jgi:hypothetical protein
MGAQSEPKAERIVSLQILRDLKRLRPIPWPWRTGPVAPKPT